MSIKVYIDQFCVECGERMALGAKVCLVCGTLQGVAKEEWEEIYKEEWEEIYSEFPATFREAWHCFLDALRCLVLGHNFVAKDDWRTCSRCSRVWKEG